MILFITLGIISATFMALLEIEIEGKDGWAGKLPTWKYYRGWFRFIPGGNKALTGYHLYLWLFIISMAHSAFLFTPWSWGKELMVAGYVIALLRLEDFLWFVFNPAFGIKKFNKESIPWHSSWWGWLPSQYYWSIILAGGLWFWGWSIK